MSTDLAVWFGVVGTVAFFAACAVLVMARKIGDLHSDVRDLDQRLDDANEAVRATFEEGRGIKLEASSEAHEKRLRELSESTTAILNSHGHELTNLNQRALAAAAEIGSARRTAEDSWKANDLRTAQIQELLTVFKRVTAAIAPQVEGSSS